MDDGAGPFCVNPSQISFLFKEVDFLRFDCCLWSVESFSLESPYTFSRILNTVKSIKDRQQRNNTKDWKMRKGKK